MINSMGIRGWNWKSITERQLKERMEQEFKNRWEAEVKGEITRGQERPRSTKLELYKAVRLEFEAATYIQLPYHRRYKPYFRFLASNHRLRVELGRHHRTQRDERCCELCPTDVEDEIHVFDCPRFEEIRRDFGITTRNEDEIFDFLCRASPKAQDFINQVMNILDKRK